eukprot:gnl/TRDRNA2_/TRDRNA2_188412_c0_seq1.p1 gnl/TRDRNA2_/TRDRNA2_188412_c0~~gnl/TRDRNA2_/TRDRNA2_188412_c0_seq1.p1  ORF type:complete len:249 (-),score=51.37 gnl/TRDRNA2_/TRDRNA2_188412_c0_seq1:52-798(-)
MSTAHYGRAVPLALRRFAKLPCTFHALPPAAPSPMMLPHDLPSGINVVLLMPKLRHIEYADSWLAVREVFERLLSERGLQREGELQLYICCLMPRLWPLRWLWRRRIRQWSELAAAEGQTSVHLLSTSGWRKANLHDRLGIHDDGRAYSLMIRNDGEILWASHDNFKEHLQEKVMVRVMQEEAEWRADEKARLLTEEGGSRPSALLDEEKGSGGAGAGSPAAVSQDDRTMSPPETQPPVQDAPQKTPE